MEREADDLEQIPHRCCKLHSNPMAVLRWRCYGPNDRKTAVKLPPYDLHHPPHLPLHSVDTNLCQVCLARSPVGIRCNHRHASFRQVQGCVCIPTVLCCPLQDAEVRREFTVGRWGTPPTPCALVILLLALIVLLSLNLRVVTNAFPS